MLCEIKKTFYYVIIIIICFKYKVAQMHAMLWMDGMQYEKVQFSEMLYSIAQTQNYHIDPHKKYARSACFLSTLREHI